MESSIVIFEGTKEEGIFSTAKKFYPENYTEKDIYNEVKKSRIKLGKKHNFSGLKMLQVTQKMEDNDLYEDNKYEIITEKHLQKKDYFLEKILADILIITNKYKGVALCHRTGDCPIIIAEDRKKKVSAIIHCNLYHINRELPKEMIKVLIKELKSKSEDIYLYIGSHIKKENYIYDNYPIKATNKRIWKNAIEEKNNKYYIDMERAIRDQLKEFKLGGIEVSKIDTAVDKRYASHRMTYLGDDSKKGQNIVGFYYKV